MNFITKRHLPRRTFLRGAGVAIALPLLDSMVPAQTPLARTAANPRSRLGCIYVPHGATMDKWTPAQAGTGFEFTETLKPLEKYRERLLVVSNLAHPQAAGVGSDAGADHARSAAVFLTGSHPEKESVHVGTSIDQIVAEKLGQDTPLPSLEVAIEENGLNCGAGYGCAYTNTISWKTPTVPLPMEHNPQVLFEKLFGEGSTSEERLARKEQSRSLLDSVTREIASLNKELPASDRSRMADYLDDVREIERRIQKAENQTPKDLKLPDAPVGVPEAFDDHFKIMFDMQILAFQANITRVATMMYARDTSGAVYPQSGVRDGFHVASHHSNNRANMDKFALINRYHTSLLAYFLEKLNATKDGDGTLLDQSMIMYGGGLGNGNLHEHTKLPVLMAGKLGGKLKTGQYLNYPENTPMANLLLTVLDKVGAPVQKLGDSSGLIQPDYLSV